MTNKLFITPSLVLGFMFALTIVVPVFGQGTDAPQTTQTTPADQDTTTEDRKALRRAEHAAQVDEVRTRSIAGKCEAAQNKITAQIKRAEEVRESRRAIYANVQEKLTSITSRLSEIDIDVTTIEAATQELNSLVVAFGEDFDGYQQALSDASSLDCEADPEGFLLAIEDAKAKLADLKEQSAAIREYFTGTIIPAIQEAKASIDSNETTDSSEVQ